MHDNIARVDNAPILQNVEQLLDVLSSLSSTLDSATPREATGPNANIAYRTETNANMSYPCAQKHSCLISSGVVPYETIKSIFVCDLSQTGMEISLFQLAHVTVVVKMWWHRLLHGLAAGVYSQAPWWGLYSGGYPILNPCCHIYATIVIHARLKM